MKHSGSSPLLVAALFMAVVAAQATAWRSRSVAEEAAAVTTAETTAEAAAPGPNSGAGGPPAKVDSGAVLNNYMARLGDFEPTVEEEGGWMSVVGPENLVGLAAGNMQVARIELNNCTMFTPAITLNAAEVTTVVRGKISAVIVNRNNTFFEQVLRAGDMFVAPPGSLHFFSNPFCEPALVQRVYNSGLPTEVLLPQTLAQLTASYLQAAFGMAEAPSEEPTYFLPLADSCTAKC